ncbi:MAG TPA: DUF2092 domain-containing protein [Kofleriaceae bacterium]
MRPRHALSAAGVALAAAALQPRPAAEADPAAQGAIDPKADALLRKMSTDLADIKAFRFEADHVMEVVTRQGEKIQSVAESTIWVQRPNKLRTDRMGPLGGATVYYDGKALSVYGKRDNLYATAKAPNTIDATIDFARDQLSIDAPGADLLYSNPYTVLMEDVVSGRYMGMEPVGNRMCHHLAYRGHETDWQLWIEDGPRALPCRFVINSKTVTGSPEYTVALSSWQAAPAFPPETFAFTPPRDAGKIDFVALKDAAQNQTNRKR